MDLVEVGASADPPVVRIMDWGKVRYERQKKERESKKKATVIEVKEVKYRPTIDGHDFDLKTKRARRFLEKGKKVKVTVFFRYRQLRRPELGGEYPRQGDEAAGRRGHRRAPFPHGGAPDGHDPRPQSRHDVIVS